MNPTTLVNALPIECTHLDGSKSTVVFRTLTIRQRYEYLHLLAALNTPAIVALCAQKPIDWIDTLTPATFKGLAKKAFDLNFRLAIELIEGDPAMAAKLAPVLLSLMAVEEQMNALPPELKAAVVELAKKQSASAASSPTPASSDSAEETGNASST